jgi:hypothetical protein
VIDASFEHGGATHHVRLCERTGRVTGAVLGSWDFEADGLHRRPRLTAADGELAIEAERALRVSINNERKDMR